MYFKVRVAQMFGDSSDRHCACQSVVRNVCEATRNCGLLVIGDGDTGFGGSGNVRRTMRGYAAAGLAGITIEDQVYPKRCSYARGLAVESRRAGSHIAGTITPTEVPPAPGDHWPA